MQTGGGRAVGPSTFQAMTDLLNDPLRQLTLVSDNTPPPLFIENDRPATRLLLVSRLTKSQK